MSKYNVTLSRKCGQLLVKVLRLKNCEKLPDKRYRLREGYGTKTTLGVYRTYVAIIESGIVPLVLCLLASTACSGFGAAHYGGSQQQQPSYNAPVVLACPYPERDFSLEGLDATDIHFVDYIAKLRIHTDCLKGWSESLTGPTLDATLDSTPDVIRNMCHPPKQRDFELRERSNEPRVIEYYAKIDAHQACSAAWGKELNFADYKQAKFRASMYHAQVKAMRKAGASARDIIDATKWAFAPVNSSPLVQPPVYTPLDSKPIPLHPYSRNPDPQYAPNQVAPLGAGQNSNGSWRQGDSGINAGWEAYPFGNPNNQGGKR